MITIVIYNNYNEQDNDNDNDDDDNDDSEDSDDDNAINIIIADNSQCIILYKNK